MIVHNDIANRLSLLNAKVLTIEKDMVLNHDIITFSKLSCDIFY